MKWGRILIKTTWFYIISILLGLVTMQVILAYQNRELFGLLASIDIKQYVLYFLFALLVCAVSGLPIFILCGIYFYYMNTESDKLQIGHKMMANAVFGFLIFSFWVQGMKLFYGDFPGALAFALGSVIAGLLIEIRIPDTRTKIGQTKY